MLARTLATLATAALLALAACGGDEEAAALGGPLTYVRSGGIAGETETLTVQPGGSGTFELDRGLDQRRTPIELSADERERLAELVSGLDLGAIDVETSRPAPDSYAYSVSYGGQEVSWETGHQPQELDALTDELARLAEKYRR